MRRLIKPSRERRLDIRCTVGDGVVGNLSVCFVFFYARRLDTDALGAALAEALSYFPLYAGRIATVDGKLRIRCEGQGLLFTTASSDRTLKDAIRSTAEDRARWLVDPVEAVPARWGFGPLFTVRVTHLADGATAIGCSWHHSPGDMQTFMRFMHAWAAAAAGEPITEPLLVEDRVAYLDEHLPPDGARKPGVRHLGWGELARSVLYLAKDARKQRTVNLYFGVEEIARMREAHGTNMRLTANDVVCAQIAEAFLVSDPTEDRRTLAIAVDARKRCKLAPTLLGNLLTTLQIEARRGETVQTIAERIRRGVDRFVDEHSDMRINQRFMDASSAAEALRCVSTAFDPVRWTLLFSNQSNVGVYRLRFEDTAPSFYTPVMIFPVPGLGSLADGVGGRGLLFSMAVPPAAAKAMSSAEIRERLHPFRRPDDDIPEVHRELHG